MKNQTTEEETVRRKLASNVDGLFHFLFGNSLVYMFFLQTYSDGTTFTIRSFLSSFV